MAQMAKPRTDHHKQTLSAMTNKTRKPSFPHFKRESTSGVYRGLRNMDSRLKTAGMTRGRTAGMTRAGGRSFPHFKRESTAFARTPKLGVPTEIMNKAFVGTPNLGVFTGIMNKAFVLSFPQSPPAQKLSFPQSPAYSLQGQAFKRESTSGRVPRATKYGFPLKDCGNDKGELSHRNPIAPLYRCPNWAPPREL